MYLLFLFVHLFFAYLLYLIDAKLEAVGFVFLGIISLILFSPYKIFGRRKAESIHSSLKETVGEVKSWVSNTIISFFSRQALFFSIFTADIAIMGIVYWGTSIFWIQLSLFIPYFILFLSFCFIVLVLLNRIQSNTLRQIIEVHPLIFSIFLLIDLFLLWGKPDLLYNIAFTGYSFFLSILLLKWNSTPIKKQIYALLFWVVFLIHWNIWLIYFFTWFSWSTAAFFLFFYSVAFFEGVSVSQFKIFRESIRAISLLWLYISTISIGIFMFIENSYWSVFFLFLSLAFNTYVHAQYENYPSLVFSTLIPVPLYYFFFWISENFWSFLISSFLLTLGLTFFWRIIRTPYRGDEYVFQTVAMLVLLGNTISFWWRVGIVGIFENSILLLLFSGMIFVSYLQIRK